MKIELGFLFARKMFLAVLIAMPFSASAYADTLFNAVVKGDVSEVKTLLDDGADVNMKNKDGDSMLHWASSRGHAEVVKLLLDRGADIHAKYKGSTSLHWAASNGRTEIVKILLSRGADIHAKDNNDWTALHYSSNTGQADTVKALLDLGADRDAKCIDYYYGNKPSTALDLAYRYQKDVVANLILKYKSSRKEKAQSYIDENKTTLTRPGSNAQNLEHAPSSRPARD